MHDIVIDLDDSGATFVLDDDTYSLLGLGEASVRRASHVVPACRPARWAFRLLRTVFGESGRVAAWTRSWRCRWVVDMRPSGGPSRLGEYDRRSDALDAERAWLRQHIGL